MQNVERKLKEHKEIYSKSGKENFFSNYSWLKTGMTSWFHNCFASVSQKQFIFTQLQAHENLSKLY